MEAKIILGRIIQRLLDEGHAQAPGLKRFGLVELRATSLVISRENGADTVIYFDKLLLAIEACQAQPAIYDQGPNSLRAFGLTHINSPLFALLRLLPHAAYGPLG